MALVLEEPEHVQHHQVPGVDVGRRRVHPELDAQLLPRLQAALQVGLLVDLDRALSQPPPDAGYGVPSK